MSGEGGREGGPYVCNCEVIAGYSRLRQVTVSYGPAQLHVRVPPPYMFSCEVTVGYGKLQ